MTEGSLPMDYFRRYPILGEGPGERAERLWFFWRSQQLCRCDRLAFDALRELYVRWKKKEGDDGDDE